MRRCFYGLALAIGVSWGAAEWTGPAVAQQVTQLQCGTERATVSVDGADARVVIGGSTYLMRHVEGGSGAKYEVPGDPDTFFWNKGPESMIAVKGKPLPICAAAAALLDGSWVVLKINDAGPAEKSRPTVTFGRDGRVTGNASCNSFSGTYTLTAEGLSIGRTVSTRRACVSPLMAQEQTLLGILGAVQRFAIGLDGVLTLHAPNDTIAARRDPVNAK